MKQSLECLSSFHCRVQRLDSRYSLAVKNLMFSIHNGCICDVIYSHPTGTNHVAYNVKTKTFKLANELDNSEMLLEDDHPRGSRNKGNDGRLR